MIWRSTGSQGTVVSFTNAQRKFLLSSASCSCNATTCVTFILNPNNHGEQSTWYWTFAANLDVGYFFFPTIQILELLCSKPLQTKSSSQKSTQKRNISTQENGRALKGVTREHGSTHPPFLVESTPPSTMMREDLRYLRSRTHWVTKPDGYLFKKGRTHRDRDRDRLCACVSV